MTVFPDAIDSFRTFTNLPGMTYDAAKSDIPFAEDLNKIVNSIISIETAVGVDFLNIWPIGSVYYNADDNRNPHDIMGFGTWVVHAEGRHIVGKASSGIFNTLGATGGAESVTLTAAQIPSHRHDEIIDENGSAKPYTLANQTGAVIAGKFFDGVRGSYTGTQVQTGLAGGGESHNNLAPYIVDCSWRRTA